MPTKGRIGKFFVNRFEGRGKEGLFVWLRENLALPPGAVCLEIGCGKGDLAKRVFDVYGPGLRAEERKAGQKTLVPHGTSRRFLRHIRSGRHQQVDVREEPVVLRVVEAVARVVKHLSKGRLVNGAVRAHDQEELRILHHGT